MDVPRYVLETLTDYIGAIHCFLRHQHLRLLNRPVHRRKDLRNLGLLGFLPEENFLSFPSTSVSTCGFPNLMSALLDNFPNS